MKRNFLYPKTTQGSKIARRIRKECNKLRKSRAEIADEILEKIWDYLSESGWIIDYHTLKKIDPITGEKFSVIAAFEIQTSRDLK